MSAEQKHTPGPWIREGTGVYALYHHPGNYKDGKPMLSNRFSLSVQASQGGDARTGEKFGCPDEEAETNARMIEALPILQDLHDSEINFTLSAFFDGQWRASLGDDLNGFKAQVDTGDFVSAVEGLRDLAIEHYPNSTFAKRYTFQQGESK